MIINIIKKAIIKYNHIKDEKRKKSYKLGKLGKNVKILEEFDYSYSSNIFIDDNVIVGYRNSFFALGEIKIGSGSIFADNVQIRTGGHNYNSQDLEYLPFDGRIYCRPVIIKENCWIGSGVIILPGVTVWEGAVIGAGSVVTKNIEAMAVVAGNPARIIKYRDKDVYEKLKSADKIFAKDEKNIKRDLI